jgi:hypothetical protein
MGVVGRLDQYASMLATEFDDYSMSENLLIQSENLSTIGSIWNDTNASIQSNVITAPDGNTTADKLVENSSGGIKEIEQGSITFTSGTSLTFSCFVKAGGRTLFRLAGTTAFFASNTNAYFDLSNETVSSTTGGVTSASIIPYPNNWYRCVSTMLPTSSGTGKVFITLVQSGTTVNYTGDGTSGIYIWGAQLEKGSVATDYTPTTTTAISRVLPETTNTNITGLGTYYSSGFDENVGFTTFLSANISAPYDLVYDEFGGTLFGAGQGRYMRQNTDKSVIVYNEIDEITDFRDIVRTGLVLDLDAGMNSSYSGSGEIWTDLSGNSNTGTLTNGPTYSSANGGSIVFDGSNDYVSIPNALSSISGSNSHTFSFWFNASNLSTDKIPFSSGLAGNYYIELTSSVFYVQIGSSYRTYSLSTSTNTWYNVCFVKNGINDAGDLYINSSLKSSYAGSITSTPSGLSSLFLGRYFNVGYAFPGNIAQVSIYNRALSAAEISQNYNALKHRFGL